MTLFSLALALSFLLCAAKMSVWVVLGLLPPKKTRLERASRGLNVVFNVAVILCFCVVQLNDFLYPRPAWAHSLIQLPQEALAAPAPPLPQPVAAAVSFAAPLLLGVGLLAAIWRGKGPLCILLGQLRWVFLACVTLAFWEAGVPPGVAATAALALLVYRACASEARSRASGTSLPPGARIEAVETAPEAGLCRVCGDPIGEDYVLCRDCGTPHHGRCWDFVGSCAIYACGCSSSQPKAKAAPRASAPEAGA